MSREKTRKLSIHMEDMADSSVDNGNDEDQIPVDDDIIHTVTKLLTFGKNGLTSPDNIETTICKLLQAERNHWKEKTEIAMNEIERQHKETLGNQVALQNLMDLLHLNTRKLSHPSLKIDKSILEENTTIDEMLDSLKYKIINLKQMAGIIDEQDEEAPQDKMLKYSDRDIEYLKNAIAKAHWEKESLETQLNAKETELKWLTKELDNVKKHLQKLQEVVKTYNESHSGANFHLNEVKNEDTRSLNTARSKISTAPLSHRQRTYIEGDWLQGYPGPNDENAVLKSRLQSQIYSSRNGNSKTGVAQCLRCQRLFKPKDNSSRSCRYHPKGREITEQYDPNGKLLHVLYKWACCKKGLDSSGCNHGHHV